VLLSADGVGTNEIMRRTGRQLGEERHSEHQPETYCRGTPLGWAQCHSSALRFPVGPAMH
jgi:hypothetical protein